jgi:opacity protein-like surface antigen
MKNVLFLIILLALLSPPVSPALNQAETSGAQKARVAASEAEIFLEASQHSIVIDTVPRGTTVTLFQSGTKNKKWLYISYFSEKRSSQVTGFIDSDRVEIIKEAIEKPQEIREEKLEKAEKEKEPPSVKQESPEIMAEQSSDENKEAVSAEKQITQQEKSRETTGSVEQETEQRQEVVEEKQALKETEKETDANEDAAQKAEEEKTTVEEAQETEDVVLPKVLTKVSVKVPRANIRLMPTTKSSVISQVYSGIELKHLAKTGNWHRVNLSPNEEGIVLSGYIHQSIVNEIFEPVVPPPPQPEEIPELEPEVAEEETEPEPEPVQELPSQRMASTKKYFWVGGGAGYTMPSESNFEKGMNLGGTFGIGVMKHLAIELRIPYFQSNVVGTVDGLSSGRLSSLSLMLSVQARYPIKNRFVPYLVAGGDYHLNTFSLNEEISNSWSNLGYTLKESVDHTFGFHFGAGLDVFLLQNIALNLDVRYYTAGLTGKWTLANHNSQEMLSGTIDNMELNSLQAGISVKLFLNPSRRKK